MAKLNREDFYTEIEHAAQTAAPLFNLYGWTYGRGEHPDLSELEDTIGELVDNVLERVESEGGDQSTSSGRFRVEYHDYEDGAELHILLELAESYDLE